MMHKVATLHSKGAAFIAAAVVVAVDQWAKHWALGTLVDHGATIKLPGPVDLTLVFNDSNAFGLVPVAGDVSRWGLAIFNIAVAAGLSIAVNVRAFRPLMVVGLSLIAAGALGNGVDRVLYGTVIDFLNAGKLGFPWIFNIADIAIDAGAGFVVLDYIIEGRRSSENAAGF